MASVSGSEPAMNEGAIEAWILFSIGVVVVLLRTYARIKVVGFKGLQADDYLAWIGVLFYAIDTAVSYSFRRVAHGLANNDMTNEQRASLRTDGEEYQLRITGSMLQVAGWLSYSVLLWALKASLLVFYQRLTAKSNRDYSTLIYVGFALVTATWIASLINLFMACRPFHRYWQIYPDPGNVCQPAVSSQLIWVYLSLNVATDLYLGFIPLPMLSQSKFNRLKSIGTTILFCIGLFVVVCAVLRGILIISNPIKDLTTATSWASRESFAATVVVNMPMIYALLLKCRFIQKFNSSDPPLSPTTKIDEKPSSKENETRDISSRLGSLGRHARRPHTSKTIHGVSLSESEEHIAGGKVNNPQSRKTWDDWHVSNPPRSSKKKIRAQRTASVYEARGIEFRMLAGEDAQEGDMRQMGYYAFARGPVRTSYHPRD